MKWQLEELTEDAIVSYLTSLCGGVRIVASWDRDDMQLPCCVVHVGYTSPISDSADWHDPRALSVEVAIMTEAVHTLAADGSIMITARQINADARSQVMDALFVSDLLTQLIAQGTPDIAFSMAHFANTSRSVDESKRVLITTITGDVIAEPVEVS